MLKASHLVGIALVLCGVAGAFAWRTARINDREAALLTLGPDDVARDPNLMALAASEGRPEYAAHCAACHGDKMQGNTRIGAPNLADQVWLYGTGDIFDIEQTILYGIRTPMNRSRHVTEMTAFGLSGRLTPGEIRDVAQYILSLANRPHSDEAALAGRDVYAGKGNCADCHGVDGRGDAYYGSPDFTANVWNNGGDADSLYHSIYFGLHRVCPGWIGVIPLEKIRALAAYIYSVSHPTADASNTAPSKPG
jgi:cytochrome c oxidase cbb3-type subunit 3